MNLFQKVRFKMHSGGYSDFKLECDALTKLDYETLAYLVSKNITFGKCYGIPKGGLAFAEALNVYAKASSDVVLIADDVLTTGKSFIEFRQQLINEGVASDKIKGVVVFVRGNNLDFVTPIFTLNQAFWQND